MNEKIFISTARLFITLSIIVFIGSIATLFTSCGNPSTLEIEAPEYLDKPCVIYYDSKNCGWCTKFKPNWESVKNDTIFKHVNFYKNKSGILFDISGVPAIIFIDNNGNVSKVVGYHSESKFRENIEKYTK